MLNHEDDAGTQTAKIIAATNEVARLTNELINAGQILNDAKGKFAEIKARIRLQKEIINTLKTTLRAENNTF